MGSFLLNCISIYKRKGSFAQVSFLDFVPFSVIFLLTFSHRFDSVLTQTHLKSFINSLVEYHNTFLGLCVIICCYEVSKINKNGIRLHLHTYKTRT